MKKVIIIAMLFLNSTPNYAQTEGKITYKEINKLEIDLPEGLDIDLGEFLPESQSTYMELFFNKHQAVYKNGINNESGDSEMESDDGSIKIMIQHDDTEEILYTNLLEKKTVHQKGFMGKNFIVKETIPSIKWKLTGEKVKYLGYECQKAVSINDEGETIAWFAPEIQSQHGPRHYNQLPGAVLMLSTPDKKLEIMATEINMCTQSDEIIQVPTKGKEVTESEFEKIMKERTKNLQEMFGGQSSFIIGN